MTELVAHEVEIATVNGRCRNKSYHLVQCYASVSHEVFVALLEVPVHVGINKAEDYCLVADQCLVVALAVAYCLLVGTSVLHLPEY